MHVYLYVQSKLHYMYKISFKIANNTYEYNIRIRESGSFLYVCRDDVDGCVRRLYINEIL